MLDVFLIGGGRSDDAVRTSHDPVVAAVGDGPIVVVVLAEGAETYLARWSGALELAGAADVRPLVVSKERAPTRADYDGAAGVFVAGGWTPGSHEALVEPGTDWLPELPFAGCSAGAAVASAQAILGGYRLGAVEGLGVGGVQRELDAAARDRAPVVSARGAHHRTYRVTRRA